MSEQTLQPCPFCGGAGDIIEDTDRNPVRCWSGFCVVCDATAGYHASAKVAAAAWNRRSALAGAAEPVAPPWWPAVENILAEHGLQAIAFVADFKAANAAPQPSPEQAAQSERLHAFLNAAAGEGLVLDGVDAAELYIGLFPERYAAAIASITTPTEAK